MIAPSLAEIAKRLGDAARGAGWPAGLARDIGQAAAWLSAQGADGVTAALSAIAAEPGPAEARQTEGRGWQIGPLPVAVAGPSALDLVLAGEGPVTLDLNDAPDLLLGLAGWASAQTGQRITLEGALSATIDAGLLLDAPHRDPTRTDIVLQATPSLTRGPMPTRRRAPLPEAWAEAGRLATLTLVPATPASRAFGAGAAGTDGD